MDVNKSSCRCREKGRTSRGLVWSILVVLWIDRIDYVLCSHYTPVFPGQDGGWWSAGGGGGAVICSRVWDNTEEEKGQQQQRGRGTVVFGFYSPMQAVGRGIDVNVWCKWYRIQSEQQPFIVAFMNGLLGSGGGDGDTNRFPSLSREFGVVSVPGSSVAYSPLSDDVWNPSKKTGRRLWLKVVKSLTFFLPEFKQTRYFVRSAGPIHCPSDERKVQRN